MATKKAQKIMKGVSCRTIGGELYWYARVNGRKAYFGKGDEGRQDAEEAKHKEQAAKGEARRLRGGLKVDREPGFVSFKELIKWYFDLPEVQGKIGYQNKIRCLSHLVDFFGKERTLNLFEAANQNEFRAYRCKEGAAQGTIDNEIRTLSAMFHKAKESKKISTDLLPGKFVRNGKTIPRRPVTETEYAALLSVANPYFKDVLTCAWETGMRSSEIARLTCDQVRLEVNPHIYLGVYDTKTGAERFVPVSKELRPILERLIEGKTPSDLVFTNSLGHPFTGTSIDLLFAWACKRAGVLYGDKTVNGHGEREGVVFHSFRHAAITRWVVAGFNDQIIRAASGHKNPEVYRNYVHIKDATPVMNLVKIRKTGKSGTKRAAAEVLSIGDFEKKAANM
jgi:integrase